MFAIEGVNLNVPMPVVSGALSWKFSTRLSPACTAAQVGRVESVRHHIRGGEIEVRSAEQVDESRVRLLGDPFVRWRAERRGHHGLQIEGRFVHVGGECMSKSKSLRFFALAF